LRYKPSAFERAGVEEDRVQFIFGEYTLDTDTRELRRSDALVSIPPLVFDLLTFLLRNRERVVSKDDLFAAVWAGRIVSDSTLGTHINAARRAIGDSGDEQKLIRTAPRKGVRFVGDVTTRNAAIAPAPEARAPSVRPQSSSDRPVIAVLPFINMSGEPQQEYFSDGISEDIITALTRLRWFHVVARNSSFACKGRAIHLKQIGEELGAGYVVEGSVRKEGGRVRITAQLSDVTTGSQLWAERYDRELADVFAVQDEITNAIVAAIEPQLYAAEHFRAQRKPTDRLDAWDLVMRALWHFWRVTRADNAASQQLLEQAVAIDPGYGQAHAMLVVSHTFGASMGWEQAANVAPLAERAALAAVRADDEDAWAHLALACAHIYSGRMDDALAALEAALRRNPNFPLALAYSGLVLTYAGRSAEGIEVAERALRLSPRDPFCAVYYGVAAWAAFVQRDYAKAMRLAREGIRQRPDFVGGYRVLTAAAGMAGETDVARAALQDLRRAQPSISLAWVSNELVLTREADRVHFFEGLQRAGMK
jgi:TolB-like protein